MIRTTLLILLFLGSLFLAGQAAAGTLTHDHTFSFGAVAPDGPAPYSSATFDDGGSPGTVTLTLEVATTVGVADATSFYFNLDPNLDPDDLVIAHSGGTGPSPNSISTGSDAFQADGDGKYDILFDLPPPPGNQRFEAGETLEFNISGIASLEVSSFNFIAAKGGGHGPFLSVARFQSTGGGEQSDWVGTVPDPSQLPEPTTIGLAALGLLGITCFRRKLR